MLFLVTKMAEIQIQRPITSIWINVFLITLDLKSLLQALSEIAIGYPIIQNKFLAPNS